ncbi:MAG: SixA phosphatase family protein [Planctomycetota bacterium]
MASRAEFPSRRQLALAIPLLPFLGRSGAPQGLPPSPDPAGAAGFATAILLRHAEKETGSDPAAPPSRDPALSQAGQERALALSKLLSRAGATHLFATEYRRTRETLVPLAGALSLEIEAVPAAELARLVERLRSLPAGSVAVVAGHSNTVPAIAQALGGRMEDVVDTPKGPMLRDDEYDRLVVLTRALAGGNPSASLIELAYGG